MADEMVGFLFTFVGLIIQMIIQLFAGGGSYMVELLVVSFRVLKLQFLVSQGLIFCLKFETYPGIF